MSCLFTIGLSLCDHVVGARIERSKLRQPCIFKSVPNVYSHQRTGRSFVRSVGRVIGLAPECTSVDGARTLGVVEKTVRALGQAYVITWVLYSTARTSIMERCQSCSRCLKLWCSSLTEQFLSPNFLHTTNVETKGVAIKSSRLPIDATS